MKPLQAFDRSWGTRRMPAAAPDYAPTTPVAVGMCSRYIKAQGLPQGPASRGHPGPSLFPCHLGTGAGPRAVASPGMALPHPLCWVLWGASLGEWLYQYPEPAQQFNSPSGLGCSHWVKLWWILYQKQQPHRQQRKQNLTTQEPN